MSRFSILHSFGAAGGIWRDGIESESYQAASRVDVLIEAGEMSIDHIAIDFSHIG